MCGLYAGLNARSLHPSSLPHPLTDSLTHVLTYVRTYARTHKLIHSLSYVHTHSLTHVRTHTHTLIHSLTHSLTYHHLKFQFTSPQQNSTFSKQKQSSTTSPIIFSFPWRLINHFFIIRGCLFSNYTLTYMRSRHHDVNIII